MTTESIGPQKYASPRRGRIFNLLFLGGGGGGGGGGRCRSTFNLDFAMDTVCACAKGCGLTHSCKQARRPQMALNFVELQTGPTRVTERKSLR